MVISKLAKISSILLMTIFFSSLTSCIKDDKNKDDENDNSSSRTILAYMVGENNLNADARADLDEMLKGSSYMSPNDTLIVFYDDCDKSKLPCIYEITNGMKDLSVYNQTPIFTFNEDVNSASTETLDKVLNFLYSQYKTDQYGIIFWSHGNGWIPSNYKGDNTARSRDANSQQINLPLFGSFGVDTGNNSSNTSMGHQMDIKDMSNVLSKFPKTDFIMFDACFMQSIEVAYELGKYTDYIIASPAEIPAWGAPYQELAKPLFADVFNPSDVIDAYHTFYKDYHPKYGIILSVVDCNKLEQFASIHKEMITNYSEQMANIELEGALNYFIFDKWNNPDYKGQYYQSDCPDYYDIKGIMQRIITDINDYHAWEEELNNVLPYSCKNDTWYSGYPKSSYERYMPLDSKQFSGLTMYVEQDKYKEHFFYNAYQHTAWAKAMNHGE
jgi:hypothetical protein